MITELCNSCVEGQVLQITSGFKPFKEFVCEAEMLLSTVVFKIPVPENVKPNTLETEMWLGTCNIFVSKGRFAESSCFNP